jgi:hypothetical protein
VGTVDQDDDGHLPRNAKGSRHVTYGAALGERQKCGSAGTR